MKKMMKTSSAMVGGKMIEVVSIKEFRRCYTKECANRGLIETGVDHKRGTNAGRWYDALGICPVAVDGNTQRSVFDFSALNCSLKSKGWTADDEDGIECAKDSDGCSDIAREICGVVFSENYEMMIRRIVKEEIEKAFK